MSFGRMLLEKEKLKQEISELLLQASRQRAAEDAAYAVDVRGDELPEVLSSPERRTRSIQAVLGELAAEDLEMELARRQERLAVVEGAEAALRARHQEDDDHDGYTSDEVVSSREPKDTAQSNFTDPESRIMKTSQEGFQQCYNVQWTIRRSLL